MKTTMNTDEKTEMKNKTALERLPGDIIGVICDFLDITERNNLLKSSKALMIEQMQFRYLNLTKEYSLRFHEDEVFRETINSLVVYPHRQISLNLSYTSVLDVSALGNVHTLDLSCTDVNDASALRNVHTLDLSYTSVNDVSALGNVHTLILCYTPVHDVRALGSVHTLDLEGTTVVDVGALGKVHTLILSSAYVEDVSALGNVRIYWV